MEKPVADEHPFASMEEPHSSGRSFRTSPGWTFHPLRLIWEKKVFSEDNAGVGVTSRLITGISTQSGVMENAAERLLGWDRNSIHELAHELSLGCMRSTIRSMKAASIKSAPNHLIDDLGKKVEEALNKVGLKVIGLDVEKIEVDLGSSSPSSPEGVAEGELVSPSKPHEDPVSEEATGFPEHSPSSSHHLT